jgi:uncharacterized protein HemX
LSTGCLAKGSRGVAATSTNEGSSGSLLGVLLLLALLLCGIWCVVLHGRSVHDELRTGRQSMQPTSHTHAASAGANVPQLLAELAVWKERAAALEQELSERDGLGHGIDL